MHLLHTSDMQAKNTKGLLDLAPNLAAWENSLFVEGIVAACYHAIIQLCQTLGLVSEHTKLYPKKTMDRKYDKGGTGDKDLVIERHPESETPAADPYTGVLEHIGVLTNPAEQAERERAWDAVYDKYVHNPEIQKKLDEVRAMLEDSVVEIKTGDESSGGSSKAIAQATHMTYASEALFGKLVTVLCSDRADKPGWRSRLYNETLWSKFKAFVVTLDLIPEVRTAFFPASLDPFIANVNRHATEVGGGAAAGAELHEPLKF
jgi:hypothetical protein